MGGLRAEQSLQPKSFAHCPRVILVSADPPKAARDLMCRYCPLTSPENCLIGHTPDTGDLNCRIHFVEAEECGLDIIMSCIDHSALCHYSMLC